MQLLVLAPTILAVWVGAFSIWAIWRVVQLASAFGFWDNPNVPRTLVVALVLFGLSVGLLQALRTGSRRAKPYFGVLAVLVVSPLIFVGTKSVLPVFGPGYYAGFDWIASERTQMVWVVLVLFSILFFTQKTIAEARPDKAGTEPRGTPYQIWMTTLYWIVTAWFTLLVLNAVSPFSAGTWRDFAQAVASGEPYRIGFFPQNILILAIALALWLRSGAAVWLVAVWAVVFRFGWLFSLRHYVPEGGLATAPKSFWLNHPVLVVGLLLAVVLIQRAKVIRPL